MDQERQELPTKEDEEMDEGNKKRKLTTQEYQEKKSPMIAGYIDPDYMNIPTL